MKHSIKIQLSVLFIFLTYVSVAGAQPADIQAGQPDQAPDMAKINIAQPDIDGVISSIVLDMDVVDFLKLLSVSCNKTIVPSPRVKGQVTGNLFNVTFKEAIDTVLTTNGFAYEEKDGAILVHTKTEYEAIEASRRKTVSRVFQLNYISAIDAQELIGPMLSKGGLITVSPKSDDENIEGQKWAGDDYIIVVDYPEQLEEIANTIKSVDKRPVQILIEATIMVASLEEDNELGVDFKVLGGMDFESLAGIVSAPTGSAQLGGTTTSMDSDFGDSLSGTGLSIGIVKNNIGMFIRALESTTDVVTLGNPKIMTLNRQQGRVHVGREDGYITTESTATSTTQTVEFLITGTTLEFTPYVMKDDYIRMKLHPEDSSGKVVLKGSVALPEKTTTEVTTNVMVKDGRTIVIGGLFREQTTKGRNQVPLLGNIPVLGNLFKSSTDENAKEEVIFLITPHIVREAEDYAAAQDVMKDCDLRMTSARESLPAYSRDRLASSHYHKAVQFQGNGDLDSALWHVNKAANLNAGHLDVIKLRDSLRTEQIYRGQYGNMQNYMKKFIK